MTGRYAVYYAPPRDSGLWMKASAWLGRDAYGGEAPPRPAPPGLDGLDLEALTADPRGYGFHATLTAPFELAAGRTEDELLASAQRLAATRSAFKAAVAPAALGRFLAFRLVAPCPEMDALHADCVRAFATFRAPLSDHDLARRRKASLTPRQEAYLQAWGYPYVFEEFRFHMTLTGSIADDGVRERVLAALREHLADVSGPHRFDGMAIFRQADRRAPFEIAARFSFATEAALSA